MRTRERYSLSLLFAIRCEIKANLFAKFNIFISPFYFFFSGMCRFYLLLIISSDASWYVCSYAVYDLWFAITLICRYDFIYVTSIFGFGFFFSCVVKNTFSTRSLFRSKKYTTKISNHYTNQNNSKILFSLFDTLRLSLLYSTRKFIFIALHSFYTLVSFFSLRLSHSPSIARLQNENG